MTLDAQTLRQSWRATYDLELDPVGPAWLPWIWSGLQALPWAAGFTVAGFALWARGPMWTDAAAWGRAFGLNLVVALCVSVMIQALFSLGFWHWGRPAIRAWDRGRRTLFFIVVPLLGVALGWTLGLWLIDIPIAWVSLNTWVGFGLIGVLGMGVGQLYFGSKARAHAAERRLAEARLRLLQAQIEPHFLFNTLAHVQTLIEVDPARAQQMLEAFVDYLRGSFVGLRAPRQTLGQEVALIQAYLQVLALRMEARLQWQIDVSADVAQALLPPLLLQPLVENAITHGLEPKIDGGRIALHASREDAKLLITITDSGLGLSHAKPGTKGQGAALANIRARLAEQWGAQAALSLSDAPGGGTVARLLLPFATS